MLRPEASAPAGLSWLAPVVLWHSAWQKRLLFLPSPVSPRDLHLFSLWREFRRTAQFLAVFQSQSGKAVAVMPLSDDRSYCLR
jgi:hypothetical protein